MMRLVIWMLRLYPQAWRERYRTEMIALLEQHSITFWTALDLLFGALDARLDPYYRRERVAIPRLPWRGLQNSWNLMITAFLTFWLTQILWVSDGGTWGPLSFSWPVTDITQLPGILAYLSLPFILTALVGWIGWQSGKNAWNLLRLLPVALFLQLLLLSPWLDGWQNAALWIVLLLSLVLTAGNLGSMLTMLKPWSERVNVPLAVAVRLGALMLIAGMASLSCVNAVWMRMFWDSAWHLAISPYWWYGPVTLTLELATMFLSTLLAVIALARSMIELRTLHSNAHTARAELKQEASGLFVPLRSDQPPEARSQSSFAVSGARNGQAVSQNRNRLQLLIWLIIFPVLLAVLFFAFFVIASFTYSFNTDISASLVGLFLLCIALGSLFIALVVGISTRRSASLSKKELIFHPMQIAHESS